MKIIVDIEELKIILAFFAEEFLSDTCGCVSRSVDLSDVDKFIENKLNLKLEVK